MLLSIVVLRIDGVYSEERSSAPVARVNVVPAVFLFMRFVNR